MMLRLISQRSANSATILLAVLSTACNNSNYRAFAVEHGSPRQQRSFSSLAESKLQLQLHQRLFSSTSSTSSTTASVQSICSEVTKQDVERLIEQKRKDPQARIFIIDCRKQEELAHGMIPFSVHLALHDIEAALAMNPETFFKTFGFEKPKTDDKVVFYCRSGVRAEKATLLFKNTGHYTNAHNYRGSFKEWFGFVYS